MRRHEREIIDQDEIAAIMQECDICRVAFLDDPFPYIVPLSFGFTRTDDEFTLLFHCADEGRKIDLLDRNGHVAFEMDCGTQVVLGDIACQSTMQFKSICGTGVLSFVSEEGKREALEAIMRHYDPEGEPAFSAKAVEGVTVLELAVSSMTAKCSPAG